MNLAPARALDLIYLQQVRQVNHRPLLSHLEQPSVKYICIDGSYDLITQTQPSATKFPPTQVPITTDKQVFTFTRSSAAIN